MLMPEQVPDEVAEAVMHCFHTRNAAKSAIAAAINAWPDLRIERLWALPEPTDGIILPLPPSVRC